VYYHLLLQTTTAQSGSQSRRGSAATSTSLASSVRRTSNAGGVPSTPDRAGSRRSSVDGPSSTAYTGMQPTLLRLNEKYVYLLQYTAAAVYYLNQDVVVSSVTVRSGTAVVSAMFKSIASTLIWCACAQCM
jgi:hypothetical protein